MLFTRCPDCETTFRVTDETLKKANGQVRCGRCASVFNAYAEIRDSQSQLLEESPAQSTPEGEARAEPDVGVGAAAEAPAPPSTEPPLPVAVAPPVPDPPPVEHEPEPATIGARSVTDVIVEDVERNVAAANDPQLISAKEVDAVLTTPLAPPQDTPQSWSAFGAEPARKRASRWWAVPAVLAVLTLAAQGVHYVRADVAAHPTFGPWIQQAYALLGVELTPRWDVRQYEILDWVATAEPNARGLGSLKIAARIRNRGPQRQPYPAVQLRLKDRWEKAVSSRVLTPAEYLPRDVPRGRLMSPGETARAEIEVVDPGPDAYGFELDICIEVEASLVTCGNDKVFL